MDEERHKRTLLEKELAALLQQQQTLENMEVKERVVRTEKVQVERDPEAEAEIASLRRTLDEEKQRRRQLDQELAELNSKFSDMDFSNVKSSKVRWDFHVSSQQCCSLELFWVGILWFFIQP